MPAKAALNVAVIFWASSLASQLLQWFVWAWRRGHRGPVGAGLPAMVALNVAVIFWASSLASQLLQ